MKQNGILLALVCLCFSFLGVHRAHAQVLYGSIVGQVDDPSGSNVPNATVTLFNKATGQTRETVTDTAGRFSIANILEGNYDVSVKVQGFRTLTRTDVRVTINTVNRLDLKLEVGQVSDEVTVQGSAAVLQTDKADTHSEITSKPITTLPLNQYRNYQALLNLVPGATPAAFQNSTASSPQRSLATNINGTNKNNNNTRLDGATNVYLWLPHHNAYVPSADTIETVNVSTGSFDAEQGMAGGAAITVITKSGTNDFHGSAYEFHDNQHLKARNFFQAPGTEKALGITNIPGATLGGRIIKNKLFFFGGWEGMYQRTGGVSRFTVPTAAMRTGDFSGYSTKIFDPRTGNSDGTGRTPFQGNKIPDTMISPIAKQIQSMLPLPNLPGTQNNYIANGVQRFDRNQGDIKINWNRSERHTIWGKYSTLAADVASPSVFGEIGGPAVVGDPANANTRVHLGTVGHTYTVSPTVVIDGTLGYTRMDQTILNNDYGTNFGSDVLGIPGTNGPDIRQSGVPRFNISNFTIIGYPNSPFPTQHNDVSWTNSDNISWSRGAHQFRFGFDMVHHSLNHWQPEQGSGPRGGFAFDGGATALRATGAAAPNLFNAYAAFLLGLPSDRDKSLQYLPLTGREWQFGWYAQDRWQVSRKLTVSLGLRYEYYPLMTRKDSGIERLDPFTNTLYMGGRGDVPTNAGISVSKLLFAPRVGIAYRVDDNTVIRTGYGLSYNPLPLSRPLRGWYPYTISQSFPANTSYGYTDILGNTLAAGIPPIVGPDISSGITSIPAGVEERSPWGKIKRGYIQSWNFTVERKLPGDFITSVGYVGTQTTNQFADRALNYSDPGEGQAGRQLYSLYGNATIDMFDGWLSANYHSLQVAMNRQFTHGLFIKGAYTWSKAINMTDEDGWADLTFLHPSQLGRNRAAASYDRTHVFQLGLVYELPFGKGKAWAQSGVASALLSGWQVNGVFAAYTGTPYTITAPGTSLNAPGTGTQTADQVKPEVKKLGGVGPGQTWFDTTAFATVRDARFGNVGRNTMRTPGVINCDLSLFRSFSFTEKYKLEFRTEATNFTNTPHFGTPNADASSPNFGVITSATGDRQLRFGLRLTF